MTHDPKQSPEECLNSVKFQYATTVMSKYCGERSDLKHEWFSREEQKKIEKYAEEVKSMMSGDPAMAKVVGKIVEGRPFCLGMIFGVAEDGAMNLKSLDNVECVPYTEELKKGGVFYDDLR
jgi:hypothetical protein